jgi:hypothetical protein
MLADPRHILVAVGGVDDQHEAIVVPVDDQVVQDAAVLAQEGRVLRPPWLQLGRVVGREVLHARLGIAPADLHLAHMRDVEEPRPGAHREVLRADPLVLDRHGVAGEGHHLGAERLVLVVQRRVLQCFRHGSREMEVRGGDAPTVSRDRP